MSASMSIDTSCDTVHFMVDHSPRPSVGAESMDALSNRLGSMLKHEITGIQAQIELATRGLYQVSSPEGDEADQAAVLVERASASALYEHLSQRLQQLARAQVRLDQGLIWICERCGQPIAVARLESLPGVTCCVECQQRAERKNRRRELSNRTIRLGAMC